jgi:hypothetical protein
LRGLYFNDLMELRHWQGKLMAPVAYQHPSVNAATGIGAEAVQRVLKVAAGRAHD